VSDPAPAGRRPAREGVPQELEEQARAAMRADAILLERTTPWLFEVGTWIFGGLIAFNVVVVSALLTVGPVDTAILVAITAFACALPLTVAGLCLLRLVKDMKEVGIDDLTLQAFKDAGYPDAEAYFPEPRERKAQQSKRSRVAFWYALGIAGLSVVLTVTGLVAALWYMAWWVGVVALVVALASTLLVAAVFLHAQPPESGAEVEAKRRYRGRQR